MEAKKHSGFERYKFKIIVKSLGEALLSFVCLFVLFK